MYDLNFFAVSKSGQSKNKSFMVFVIILLVIVLLLNVGLFVGRQLIYSRMEKEIESMQAFIDDPATRDAIQQAEQIKKEADLTTNYLTLLQTVDQKLDQLDFIESDLLDHIRLLTPPNTVFSNVQVSGIRINLNCESTEPTGPMDMYHAFRASDRLTNVVLSGISINEAVSTFSITCQVLVEGGDAS